MMVTWHSLGTTVMQKLLAWKVPITSAHSAAYLHLWRLSGHLLGIRDEYLPASWAAANDQAKPVLDPVLAPTPEGIDLAQILLNRQAVTLFLSEGQRYSVEIPTGNRSS